MQRYLGVILTHPCLVPSRRGETDISRLALHDRFAELYRCLYTHACVPGRLARGSRGHCLGRYTLHLVHFDRARDVVIEEK